MSQTDVIDYKIGGGDIQYVEIELDPGESVVSEAGAMMYKSPSIGMD
ncbi:MAG: AIM24 family protein, partial [Maricaulis sp.]